MSEIISNSEVEISVVSPVYMAEGIINLLVKEISEACNLVTNLSHIHK